MIFTKDDCKRLASVRAINKKNMLLRLDKMKAKPDNQQTIEEWLKNPKNKIDILPSFDENLKNFKPSKKAFTGEWHENLF